MAVYGRWPLATRFLLSHFLVSFDRGFLLHLLCFVPLQNCSDTERPRLSYRSGCFLSHELLMVLLSVLNPRSVGAIDPPKFFRVLCQGPRISPNPSIAGFFTFHPISRIFEFIGGCLTCQLFLLVRRHPSFLRQLRPGMMAGVAVASIAVLMLAFDYVGYRHQW